MNSPEIRTHAPADLDTFDRLARLVASRQERRGLTLETLAGIGAVCRELDAPEPDVARLQELATDLGLTDADLETLDTLPTPETP